MKPWHWDRYVGPGHGASIYSERGRHNRQEASAARESVVQVSSKTHCVSHKVQTTAHPSPSYKLHATCVALRAENHGKGLKSRTARGSASRARRHPDTKDARTSDPYPLPQHDEHPRSASRRHTQDGRKKARARASQKTVTNK